MKAVGAYAVIKQVKGQTVKRKSGLEIPAEMEERYLAGEIYSVSKQIGEEEFGLKKGQKILFDKHAGHEVKGVDGEEYRVLTCRDIAVIL